MSGGAGQYFSLIFQSNFQTRDLAEPLPANCAFRDKMIKVYILFRVHVFPKHATYTLIVTEIICLIEQCKASKNVKLILSGHFVQIQTL